MRFSSAVARRVLQAVLPFLVLPAAWQLAAQFSPPYLFPSLLDVGARFVGILLSPAQLADVGATVGRILAGLAGAFALGTVLAFAMGRSPALERFCAPLLTFSQGIPALSWVVFAIIWLKGIEFRIFFIMLLTTLPAFSFQLLDAFRAISKDLFEMVLSFRPTRAKLFRVLILPSVVPGILTAWKINLGNASRVVVVAELVGASGGVGYELLQQQQQFDMAGAIAWTLQLVVFVLLVQLAISLVERRLLRYRGLSERRA